MTSESQASSSSMWDWWQTWMKAMPNPLGASAAPQTLDQAILPGWVFGGVVNVTEQNSAAPDTEREIVSAHSYGRELGRLMDAVAALVADLPQAKQTAKPFARLKELQQDIDRIKTNGAARRLDRVIADLEVLRETKHADYDRIAARLREVLKI